MSGTDDGQPRALCLLLPLLYFQPVFTSWFPFNIDGLVKSSVALKKYTLYSWYRAGLTLLNVYFLLDRDFLNNVALMRDILGRDYGTLDYWFLVFLFY